MKTPESQEQKHYTEHLAIEYQSTWHTSKHVLKTCQIYSRKRQFKHWKNSERL